MAEMMGALHRHSPLAGGKGCRCGALREGPLPSRERELSFSHCCFFQNFIIAASFGGH
jgi:hypothetical protein